MLENAINRYSTAEQSKKSGLHNKTLFRGLEASGLSGDLEGRKVQKVSKERTFKKAYLYIAAALGAGAILFYQWKNMLPEFCPSRFKQINTEEELLKAVKIGGHKMTECAAPSLLMHAGIYNQIELTLFRREYCPDPLVTKEEELLELIRKEGSSMKQCADSTLIVSKQSIDSAHEIWSENYLRQQKRKETLLQIQHNPNYLQKADDDIKDDEAIVLEAVKKDGQSLQHASRRLRGHREVVLAAVKQWPRAFEFSDPNSNLRGDEEIVKIAINEYPYAIGSASLEIQKNRDFVLRAVKSHGSALKFASPEFKKDKEVVLASVQQDGLALEFVDEELKKDPDVLRAAISNDLMALRYLSEELKPGKQELLALMQGKDFSDYQHWYHLLKYFPENLKNDDEVIFSLIKHKGYVLKHAHPRFGDDEKVVIECMKVHYGEFQFASERLKADEDFVYAAVQINGWNLNNAHEKFRSNKRIALAAVKQNPFVGNIISAELQKDKDILDLKHIREHIRDKIKQLGEQNS